MSSITESVESIQSLEVEVELAGVLAALKEFDCGDLFKVIKTATIEAEKRMKAGSKVVAKKEGRAPKGIVPKQLRKPRAWVEFTLQHALENGWESFVITKSGEEIEMPASVEHQGAHVYPDSWSEKLPAGKQLILTHAMSLSKHRWAPKNASGTNKALYDEFSAKFDATEPATEPSTPVSDKLPAVRKTAAEKETELAAKKAAKEEEKAAAKLAKEEAKAAAKLAKEAEKAEIKRVKDLEKAAAKEAKGKIPTAAVKSANVKPAATKKAAQTPKPAVKASTWSCPADGAVHPWPYKGKKFLRNSDNQVWEEDSEGGCGDWQGVYIETEDRIDDSVEEPSFDDE